MEEPTFNPIENKSEGEHKEEGEHAGETVGKPFVKIIAEKMGERPQIPKEGLIILATPISREKDFLSTIEYINKHIPDVVGGRRWQLYRGIGIIVF